MILQLAALLIPLSFAQSDLANYSLDHFLAEVTRTAPDIRAGTLNQTSASLRESEGSILFAPTLGLSAGYQDDQRTNTTPTFTGTRQTASSAQLSLTQVTPWGMNAKFSYSLTSTNVVGSLFLPIPQYVTWEPRLELTQALWSGAFGISTRAQRAATDATNRASFLAETFKSKQLIARAELAYWRLAFARRIVEVQKTVLGHATALLEWTNRRAALNLADKSDALQSEAAYQLRKIELAGAEDEERAASIEFNKVRGRADGQVAEKLVLATPAMLQSLTLGGGVGDLSTPPRLREDVQAARAQEEASSANFTLMAEKNRPSLDLSLSYGGNGLDASSATAFSQSWTFSHPYLAVMLKLSMPLAFGRQSDVREAYSLAKQASGYQAMKTDLDAAQEWRDLTRAFQDTRKRLVLAEELASLQRKKLEYERDRLRRGRSVTSQVLFFEQDSLQAELNLVRVSSELLRVHASLKTFGELKP